MDYSLIIAWLGFILAGYSVVGNDSIQTLGTFLSSNEDRPWYLLWLYAGGILTFTLVYGWAHYGGDVSYARLSKIPMPDSFAWYYLLPPLTLMALTRSGIPVSTTFMILTFFHPSNLGKMVNKSLMGYVMAFVVGILVYTLISVIVEKRFMDNPATKREKLVWTVLQWFSTGFLWSQWLIQDFANIFVYLPRSLPMPMLVISMSILLLLLAYIFYSKGGTIQGIVKSKTNTVDIRSATIIDFTYASVLLYFTELNPIPMSTTWVFVGLLAGREIAIRLRLEKKLGGNIRKMLLLDLGKIIFGLLVSVILVFIMRWISGEGWN